MDTKVLKAIAHHLDPIVTIGSVGLSTSVIAELKRAISDHEMIKIRLNVGDRSKLALLYQTSRVLGINYTQPSFKDVQQSRLRIRAHHRVILRPRYRRDFYPPSPSPSEITPRSYLL